MSELLNSVDERTRLAGTNKLELLLFRIGETNNGGKEEVFGINVFKVREVMRSPLITRAPNMHESVIGMVSLRGVLVPVIDLAKHLSITSQRSNEEKILIVTEYNGNTQGFLVDSVENILRLEWKEVHEPPEMMSSGNGGSMTGITELADGRIAMLLDVEKILSETSREDEQSKFKLIEASVGVDSRIDGCFVFFVDDSSTARNQIGRTLDMMGVKHASAVNGRRAWGVLDKMATEITDRGERVCDHINLVLTDVEMPDMDGYALTKKIKEDSRFNGVKVLMHSSLSGQSNRALGESVGVDEYVSKFEPVKLSQAIKSILSGKKHA